MKLVGFLYAIGAAVTWGMVYALDQKILVKLSPLMVLMVSSLITMVLAVPLMMLTDPAAVKTFFSSGKQTQILLVVSSVLAIMANYLILSSVKMLGAASASVIEISYPFFVVLFTVLLYGARVSAQFFIGALLIFLGTALVIRAS